MVRRLDFSMRLMSFLLFAVAVFLYGWNSDDAYHSYIMAKHLVEGKGLVYNTGFRVTASTSPLLTLIEALVFLFTDNVDACGLLIGFSFSVAAAWILIFRICPTPVVSLFLSGLMVVSGCFLSFTTSGLENPILFFFGAVFFDVYFHKTNLSMRGLFTLSVLMSLIAMTRTDSVLIFAPMAVWAYLARTKISWPMRIIIGIAGFSLFVIWIGFSVFYYGFPFPNTYYAKLYTGIPVSEYIIRGLKYYPASWLVDPMLLLVPAFVICIAITKWNKAYIPLFIGLTLYCLYVVSIGGDFMAGRHLTQQYFLLLCLYAFLVGGIGCPVKGPKQSIDRKFFCLTNLFVVTIILVGSIINYCIPKIEDGWPVTNDVVDERHFYLSYGGELPMFTSLSAVYGGDNVAKFRGEFRKSCILRAYKNGDKGLCFGSSQKEIDNPRFFASVLFGKDIFASLDLDMYLTDVIALQDPLMARLKVNSPGNWRVGHIIREIPRGYNETLASGENRIENPSLHAYYDKLLLVMKGPLFDRNRLLTILGFNCGEYDGLLEQYERDRLSSCE